MSTSDTINVENTNTFGNYLIHGIDEIMLPEPISWWPLAAGWQALGLWVLVVILYMLIKWSQARWRNRYRRQALRELSELGSGNQLKDVVAALPFYLKATALQTYTRHEVAALSGDDWLRFLDDHYKGPEFSNGIGQKLLNVAYAPVAQWDLDETQSRQLIAMSRRWIETHAEPQHV